MPIISVSVKWSGKKFDAIELDTDESPELFKTQIFSQTGVPPERQKIMVKGGMLKDDTDLNKLGLKNGHTFMMMGTAGEIAKPPPKPVQFIEDMSDAQVAKAMDIPTGLDNLGNTCYMNSTLQCLRAMPELGTALNKIQSTAGADQRDRLAVGLRDLFKRLDGNPEQCTPTAFWMALQQVCPQFAQMGPGNMPMQHDAEECWSEIITVLKNKLPVDDTTSSNFVEKYMTGQMRVETKCLEAPDEEAVVSHDAFSKLGCHISISTNYMANGILDSLKEHLEKNSPSLNRSAQYERVSQVERLPKYLPVHFIRFFWKPQERIRAKILRKVAFPLEFDATSLCTLDLQSKFSKAKAKIKEVEDIQLQKKRDEKRRKADEDAVMKETSASSSSADTSAKDGKVNWDEYLDPELAKDPGCNPSGLYELGAVLTHIGRSADSGHYIGWVKKGQDEWHKFDDDKVTVVRDADIEKLAGGGDGHTAYIVLYRAKELN
ncbi:cysteine proteinase [Hesseltinella vesiculosa]|uniref:Ubiquitin carboxyl-terminal hydrolase n=1 Tax=Hesseltinella vesiculosa TaxID=101127 RepID=A0A1X2GMS7_9FUNG|nr:cysteine proteinase [Hesseltinella vesiculosa]